MLLLSVEFHSIWSQSSNLITKISDQPIFEKSVALIFDQNNEKMALSALLSLVKTEPRVMFNFFLIRPAHEVNKSLEIFSRIAKLSNSSIHAIGFTSDHTLGGSIITVKMFLCELLPRVNRVLLLDTDIFVSKPISHLFGIDMTNKVLAGALAMDRYPRRWINSGLILYNLELLRTLPRGLTCAKAHAPFYDDAWHTLCFSEDAVILLPYRYNIMVHAIRESGHRKEIAAARVFHFMKEAKRAFSFDNEAEVDSQNWMIPVKHRASMKQWIQVRKETTKL